MDVNLQTQVRPQDVLSPFTLHRSRAYQALARLLEYPQNKESLLQCLSTVISHVEPHDVAVAAAPFKEFVDTSTLAELQERFVATFDFNPAKAPYLGHHLYGDNQKKAAYMIMLKQEYQRFGFAPRSNELPDYLPVILSFLSHLTIKLEDTYRRQFIRRVVLPGVEKLTAEHDKENRWHPLIQTAHLLLSDDCKEVAP